MMNHAHLKIFGAFLALFMADHLTLSLRVYKPGGNPNTPECKPEFTCGETNIQIKYPFLVKGHPESCVATGFELSCDQQNRTVFSLGFGLKRDYYLKQNSIDYGSRRILLLDPGLKQNNCSTLPLYSFPDFLSNPVDVSEDSITLIFVACKTRVRSDLYFDTDPCVTAKDFSSRWSKEESAGSGYSYVVVGKNLLASDIEETCTIYRVIDSRFPSIDVRTRRDVSYPEIHEAMALGFELEWYRTDFCSLKSIPACLKFGALVGGKLLVWIITIRIFIGIIPFSIFLICKWRRRHLSIYDAIEKFLQSRNNLIPIRYSYKQIKKMTNNFKEKLGEGGYGSVYKGKLRSGHFVAIKMLSKSKANVGQDFINEVATLGRIHHVNVVRLVGFCASASHQALVYDYMPNGSLDKFIFAKHPNGIPMSWKNLYEIAIGIARGIEYLHRGCNIQILHFDIKPHNILLDENFAPKISDFGLAKLYSIQESHLATLTTVRGTLGYMAPELFYKKVGKVSNKADVYSFGMLLMDMAGRWRNGNSHTEHSSQIDFPSWIHDKFDQEEDMDFGDADEDEVKIARKLIFVALWCVQLTPTDRPSMRDVLEMFEGDVEGLQMPPKPQFCPLYSPRLQQANSSCSFSEDSTEPLYKSEGMEIE